MYQIAPLSGLMPDYPEDPAVNPFGFKVLHANVCSS